MVKIIILLILVGIWISLRLTDYQNAKIEQRERARYCAQQQKARWTELVVKMEDTQCRIDMAIESSYQLQLSELARRISRRIVRTGQRRTPYSKRT